VRKLSKRSEVTAFMVLMSLLLVNLREQLLVDADLEAGL